MLTDQWRVTSSCPASGACTAQITPSSGAAFTLTLADGTWTGARTMPTAVGCVGAYTIALSPASGPSRAAKMVGVAHAVFGGCGQPGTEDGTLVINRQGS
jgi:hypothetical protein